jgi:hypothetical protein
MQLVAQQPPENPPLKELLLQKHHAEPASPSAQRTPEAIFDASGLGSPMLLYKGWRVGITDNPAAVSSTFDDSAWAIRDAKESFAEVPDEDHPADTQEWDKSASRPQGHQRPFAVFRLHVKLAPNHGPVSLLIKFPFTQNHSLDPSSHALGMEVFANGRDIQPDGPHPDVPEMYEPISRIYNLNLAPSDTSLTLVVRTVYIPFGLTAYTNFFAIRSFRLGHPDDLARELALSSADGLFERLPRLINSVLLVVLSLFLLTLYFTQKNHPEYLLLALYEAIQAPMAFVEMAGSTARMDLLWYGAVNFQLILISAYLYYEFLVAFLSLRRSWNIRLLRYTAPVLAAVGPSLLLVGRHADRTTGLLLAIVAIFSLLWVLDWLIFIFFTLIVATIRRNFEAGLLLIPLVLSVVGIIDLTFSGGIFDWGGGQRHSPLTFQAGPIPIRIVSVADLAGIFAIVLIIFVRFLRVQRDQERASSELAAARSVQELMIPQEKLETPGFEVESVYNPANEVGGDFYHVEATGDGGLLVVVGDVAGKGLKAAMNVSMLMGALRHTPERSPARILASLNRVLVGGDSFTTCQAAWFGANGELVLANAGHLPPYLNSQEVSLPGGLPLGVLSDVSYPEVQLYLHPGDRILLISDGVVEARQPSGELFGFDRVHNLSNQSAFYIADAARDFGQEDDITVLTVRRLAQAVAA